MLLLLALLLAFASASENSQFPHFYQCDSRWGDHLMGMPNKSMRDTICHQGCAMTCLAMALAGNNISIPKGNGGQQVAANPGTLNDWLIANDGYKCIAGDCVNLVLDAPNLLPGSRMQLVGEWGGHCCGGVQAKPALETLKTELSLRPQRLVFIAHVRASTHFVLLRRWNEAASAFEVLDPNFNTTQYSYADISDIIIYSIFPATAVVPKRYPLWKQFSYKWGAEVMVRQTIGAVGCLMSSTSMALNGHGIAIPSPDNRTNPSDPHTLNQWLQRNHGYVGGDDLVESRVPALDPAHVGWPSDADHRSADLSLQEVAAMLRAGRPVIANVLKGRHFVLVVGTDALDNTLLHVNDPGFYTTSYAMREVVGWRLFAMNETMV